MPERGNVAVVENGTEVWLYTYLRGHELPSLVRYAMQRGKSNWSDPPYLARVIFQTMIGDDRSNNGFGISAEAQTFKPHHPHIIVNCDTQTVTVGDKTQSFNEFTSEA